MFDSCISNASLEFIEDFKLHINDANDVFATLTAIGEYACIRDREYAFLILLNDKWAPIGVHLLSIGSSSDVSMSVRESMRALALSGACGFIIAHTHPSGLTISLKPSIQDCNLTDRYSQMSKLTGIPMIDSVIIGREGIMPIYLSLREKKFRNFSSRKISLQNVGEFYLPEETFPPLPDALSGWEDNPMFLSHYTEEELAQIYPNKNFDFER